jgi:hypothetical protein
MRAAAVSPSRRDGRAGGRATAPVDDRTRVLLIVSRPVLDQARMLAGTATATLRIPVSLQIVLRVLIEEGLRREHGAAVLAGLDREAQAVRRRRGQGRRPGPAARRPASRRSR